LYDPATPPHDNSEFRETNVVFRVTLAGVRVHVRPVVETDADRTTVPVNPLRPVPVIVKLADAIARIVSEAGVADKAKSCTW
jgi:hypothetical protein